MIQGLDPSMLNALIRERRSHKPGHFVPGKKVPDEVVRQALVNATWAPNHGKTEPWFFQVFTGDGLKKLSSFQSEFYKKECHDNFNEGKYKKLASDPLLCSHVIAICLKRAPGVRIPVMEEVAAVACAVQNIYLTITAYGYGGYWSTGGVTYMPAAKPFFGLGEQDQLLGFFSVGEIAVKESDSSRKPVEEISAWVND
jgi:nitroreductase